MRKLLSALVMAGVGSGCSSQYAGDDAIGSIEQPSICGATTDWQDVEQYDGTLGTTIAFVSAHEQPVGRITWKNDLASRYTNPGNVSGQPWCTGTLISDNLFLTAGHCFDPDSNGWTWPRVNGTNNSISAAQGATEMQVNFNYQVDASGNPRPTTTVSVVSLREYRLGGLDYGVIQLAGTPAGQFGRTTVGAFALGVDRAITVIQHPSGLYKKVHAGIVTSSTSTSVAYNIADTLGGSSGSGVLDNATGYLETVHTLGGCTATGGSNSGTPVTAIVGSSPLLSAIAFDAAKLMTALL